MLIILQELMHRTFVEIEGRAPKRHEIPKPCEHFDLIAGTGTGGLIAIMLGRLRLDIDTCKDVYVRMTRRVFETDKTIAGIPYRSTLFKASKLEEAIRECVREHTIFDDEGNDALANAIPMSADVGMSSDNSGIPSRSMSQSSRYSQVGMSPTTPRAGAQFGSRKFGNPNALLYDTRENRTKTAVTAMFKGTNPKNGSSVMLRSYDSRKEPAPDVNCTIWQAGRATSATGLAFKPIQVGQSVYHDEGAGKYNPAPQVLDEAVINEYPGRDVGVFISIGTGKRPSGTGGMKEQWYESFLGGSMGDFAEARKRLWAKIEGCEDTHQYMKREYLGARNVNSENYYRLNVEVGVGEFGMNEWSRLSDISTNTRMYLSREEVQKMNLSSSAKIAKIHFAKVRHERAEARAQRGLPPQRESWENPWEMRQSAPPPSNPMAVELPGDEPYFNPSGMRGPGQQYEHRPSIADQKYMVVSSDEYPQIVDSVTQTPTTPPQRPAQPHMGSQYQSPASPGQYPARLGSQHTSPNGNDPSPRVSFDDRPSTDTYRRTSADGYGQRPSPPPLPPKTPLQTLPYPNDMQSPNIQSPTSGHPGYHSEGPRTFMNMGDLGRRLPYPDIEGPPPAVNTANKPQVSR